MQLVNTDVFKPQENLASEIIKQGHDTQDPN